MFHFYSTKENKGGIFIKEEKHIFCGHLWERGSREKNEDSIAFWHMKRGQNHRIMAIVCDGIGGLEEGEQASSYVVRQLANWFMTEGYKLKPKKQGKILQQLCFQIHNEIGNYGKENKIRLGTAVTVVLMDNRRIFWYHIGDCSLYLLREKTVKKLTKEHHDERGNLNRAIGAGTWYLFTMSKRRIRKKDRFLLCSDGFYRNLDMEELRIWNKRKIENDSQANRMLRQICQKKIARGEKDNISALYFGYIEKI